MIVEVCERMMDYYIGPGGEMLPKYHACIAGEQGYWSCGRSVEEALADLLKSHPERFPGGRDSLDVRYVGRLCR